MSVNAGGGESAEKEGVCRDFLRNVCRRGDRCKFSHSTTTEQAANEEVLDYQASAKLEMSSPQIKEDDKMKTHYLITEFVIVLISGTIHCLNPSIFS